MTEQPIEENMFFADHLGPVHCSGSEERFSDDGAVVICEREYKATKRLSRRESRLVYLC